MAELTTFSGITNNVLGQQSVFTVTRHDTTYWHTVSYTCGTAKGYVVGSEAGRTQGTSFTWNVPLDLAKQNIAGSTVEIKFELRTYDNANKYLGSVSLQKTYAIPSTLAPEITSITVTDTMGYMDRYTKAIQGLSKLKVSVTAKTSYDSPIASYKIIADGNTYTTPSVTTDVLKFSGNTVVSALVTDQRGRQDVVNESVPVYAYTAPKISKLTVHRSNSSGTEDPQGSYITVIFSSSVTSLDSQNSASHKLYYRASGTSSWSLYTTQTSYTVTDYKAIFSASTEKSFEVKLEVTDNFGMTSSATSASTAATIIDFRADGQAVGFGKVAEAGDALAELVDFGWKIRSAGGYLQPVLATGSNLNDIRTPNTYTLEYMTRYTNLPPGITDTAMLEVYAVGVNGQTRQVVTSCHFTNPKKYERYYYVDGSYKWGDWILLSDDTGWHNLTLASGISVTGNYNKLEGRIKNNILYLRGEIKGVSSDWQIIATLPTALSAAYANLHRLVGVYNAGSPCALTITKSTGYLSSCLCPNGSWNSSYNIVVDTSIHL